MRRSLLYVLVLAALGFAVYYFFGIREKSAVSAGPIPAATAVASDQSRHAITPQPDVVEARASRHGAIGLESSAAASRRAANADSYVRVVQQGFTSNVGAEISAARRALHICMIVRPIAGVEDVLLKQPAYQIAASKMTDRERAVRKDVIEDLRKRCAEFNTDGMRFPSNEAAHAVTQSIGRMNVAHPSPEDIGVVRSAFAAGRLDAVEIAVRKLAEGAVGYRDDLSPSEVFSQDAARAIAMCQLGEDCEPGSFLSREACINYGICEASDVAAQYRALHERVGASYDRSAKAATAVARLFLDDASTQATPPK